MEMRFWATRLLLTVIVTVLTLNLHGQESDPEALKPYQKSDPIIDNVHSKMSLNTGKLNVQVPLFTINAATGVNIPVSLNYQTSGIKVDDIASWVGLGWNLNAGGKITRMQRGREFDENGYGCQDGGQSDGAMAIGLSNPANWGWDNLSGYLREHMSKDADLEPDIFHFNIPGYSGTFICDHDGNGYSLPHQNLIIKWNNHYLVNTFVITDSDGVSYEFNSRGIDSQISTYSFSLREQVGESKQMSWYLNKIKKGGRTVVNFIYTVGYSYTWDRPNWTYNYDNKFDYDFSEVAFRGMEAATIAPGQSPSLKSVDGTEQYTESVKVSSGRLLKSIVWDGGSLDFITKATRNDIPNAVLLERIVYKNYLGEHIRDIVFEHGVFSNKLPYLKRVYLQKDWDHLDICGFEYNTRTNLPGLPGSLDYDYWGYYNDARNTQTLPTFRYGSASEKIYLGADRLPRLYATKANILTKIKYPTGGFKTFSYELNYTPVKEDTYPLSDNKRGGLRISSIAEYESIDATPAETIYLYIKPDGSPSGSYYEPIYLYPNVTLISNMAAYGREDRLHYSVSDRSFSAPHDALGNDVLYSHVLEVLPDRTSNYYEFTTYEDHPDIEPAIYSRSHQPVIRYPKRMIPKTSRAYMRGLLKSKSIYAATQSINAPVNERDLSHKEMYTYSSSPVYSVPAFINRGIYHQVTPGTTSKYGCLGIYKWDSESVNNVGISIMEGSYNWRSEKTFRYSNNVLRTERIKMPECIDYKYPLDYELSFNADGNGDSPDDPDDCDGPDANGHLEDIKCAILRMQQDNIIMPLVTNKTAFGEYLESEVIVPKIFTMYDPDNSSVSMVMPAHIYRYYPEETEYNLNDCPYNTMLHETHDLELTIHKYNYDGGIISSTGRDGLTNVSVYGYRGNYVIADVGALNIAGRSQDCEAMIYHNSFEDDPNAITISKAKTGQKVNSGTFRFSFTPPSNSGHTFILTYWQSKDDGDTWEKCTRPVGSGYVTVGETGDYVDEVRICPKDSRMTTYTYIPGLGKISEMDHNGKVTYWEYDPFGRVKRVLDDERNVLEQYNYNYVIRGKAKSTKPLKTVNFIINRRLERRQGEFATVI